MLSFSRMQTTMMGLCLLLLVACGEKSSPEPHTPRRDPARSAARPEARRGTPADTAANNVLVTAAAAKAHKLPAIGFSLSTRGTAMIGKPLSFAGTYLVLSGPPGGPLSFVVHSYSGTTHDAAALKKALQAWLNKPYHKPVTFGAAATQILAGAARPALSVAAGKVPARTHSCGVLVPAPGDGTGGLLVVFGYGVGSAQPLSCAKIATHNQLAPLIRSFRLER